MKRSQPRRDWSDARAKVAREGCCRACGSTWQLEAAHVVGREHDGKGTFSDYDESRGQPRPRLGKRWVLPLRIIPLCAGCHRKEHRHELDTLPLLTLDEQLQAVADCGGIEQARVRLAPSQYARRAA